MRHRALVLGLIAVTTFCAASGQSEADKEREAQEKAVKAAAKEYLVTFAEPSPETQQSWGMTDFHIFGWGSRSYVLGGAVDSGEINRIDGTGSYELVLKFWCSGTSLSGEPLKLKRTLHLRASTPDNGRNWQIENAEFRDDQPLEFLDQLLPWLFVTFVVVPVVVGIGLVLTGAWNAVDRAGCFIAPVFGLVVPWFVYAAPLFLPAYSAYEFFDSWVFAGICFIVSVAVTVGIAKGISKAFN